MYEKVSTISNDVGGVALYKVYIGWDLTQEAENIENGVSLFAMLGLGLISSGFSANLTQ